MSGDKPYYSWELGPKAEWAKLTEAEADAWGTWMEDFMGHLIDTNQDRAAFGFNVTMILERNRRSRTTQLPGMWGV